jgi:hypothetical protein
MRLGKTTRKVARPVSVAFISAVLLFGGARAHGHSHQEVNSWYDAASPVAAKVHHGTRDSAPDPPSMIVLMEASDEGVAKGLELASLSERLSHTLKTGSLSGDEALELFHHTFCLAILWLLDNRVDPGSPAGMGRVIDAFLAVNGLPTLDYETAGETLEDARQIVTWGLTTDELARKVADAACDAT